MPYVFLSHSLRQILPRKELREIDRRSGAYPVKSKTGDRTRTGRNKIHFDDTRVVMFATGVNITYPTTLQFDRNKVSQDLTSSIGSVIGNVDAYAVDQFITHFDQSERPGPFVESKLFEQNEHAVVNSAFMTGAAFGIAPDRFKSKLSDKTILRFEHPIAQNTSLHPSASAMHYYNTRNSSFDNVIVENNDQLQIFYAAPFAFDRVLFTPYGFTHSPVNFDLVIEGLAKEEYFGGTGTAPPTRESLLQKIVNFTPDGGSDWDVNPNILTRISASLLNPNHAANSNQTIKLSGSLSQPFLLEKAILELDIEAGAGWLNDSFTMGFEGNGDLTPWYCNNIGGPAITFSLLRQDKSGARHRDLIASGAITNAFDIHTASFIRQNYSAGIYDVAWFIKSPLNTAGSVNQIIYGTSLSGSTNAFTGTVKIEMDPAVTQHILRSRTSGTIYLNTSYPLMGEDGNMTYMAFSSNGRRPGSIVTERAVLGNQLAMLKPSQITNTIPSVVPLVDPGGFTSVGQFTTNIVSTTVKTPYLLYPEDELIVCISKCKHGHVAHDVKIKSGLMKLTLYGDLIKEDREYHDTLNQRLETVEVWENVGEEPILDQFDITYKNELSGSYLDRFTLSGVVDHLGFNKTYQLSSSVLTSVHGNFTDDRDNTIWSSEFPWSSHRRIFELKKSNKNLQLTTDNEVYWDTRIPDPSDAFRRVNPRVTSTTGDLGHSVFFSGDRSVFDVDPINSGVDTPAANALPSASDGTHLVNPLFYSTSPGQYHGGLGDWWMSYPYENKFDGVSQTFANTIANGTLYNYRIGTATKNFRLPYANYVFELGDLGSSNAPTYFRSGGFDKISDSVRTLFQMELNEIDPGSYTPMKVFSDGSGMIDFLKIVFGIGNGFGAVDNQHVRGRKTNSMRSSLWELASQGNKNFIRSIAPDIRGWRYGMLNAFPMTAIAVFRRDRFGQFRDMLEQRLDTKFHDGFSVKESPIQVRFYDRNGYPTESTRTLSSNLSLEATSSMPYTDGIARNRPAIDYDNLNISVVTV